MNWSKITVLDLKYEARNGKCPNPLNVWQAVLWSSFVQ